MWRNLWRFIFSHSNLLGPTGVVVEGVRGGAQSREDSEEDAYRTMVLLYSPQLLEQNSEELQKMISLSELSRTDIKTDIIS